MSPRCVCGMPGHERDRPVTPFARVLMGLVLAEVIILIAILVAA